MKHFLRWAIFLCLFPIHLSIAQTNVTLSGYVKDASNGEALIQATVVVPELGKGAYTNEYGFFSISLPPATYSMRISYVGFLRFRLLSN